MTEMHNLTNISDHLISAKCKVFGVGLTREILISCILG
jgi:hypothetical protein